MGPVLFLIMISDIDKNMKHSILSSFADDTRLKFAHFPYCKNQELTSCSTYPSDTGQKISTKDTVKESDLGVLLSNDLTYNSNVQMIVSKVKITSSWIYQTFKTREQSTLLTLWKSLVNY